MIQQLMDGWAEFTLTDRLAVGAFLISVSHILVALGLAYRGSRYGLRVSIQIGEKDSGEEEGGFDGRSTERNEYGDPRFFWSGKPIWIYVHHGYHGRDVYIQGVEIQMKSHKRVAQYDGIIWKAGDKLSFPQRLRCKPRPVSGDKHHNPIGRGQSNRYWTVLDIHDHWELLKRRKRRMSQLVIWSQGRVVKRKNLSKQIKGEIDTLVEWQRSNGALIDQREEQGRQTAERQAAAQRAEQQGVGR